MVILLNIQTNGLVEREARLAFSPEEENKCSVTVVRWLDEATVNMLLLEGSNL